MVDSFIIGLLQAAFGLLRKDRKAAATLVWENRRAYTVMWYVFYYTAVLAFLASVWYHVWEGMLYFGWASWWMHRKKPEIDNGSAWRKHYVREASR